MATTLFLCCLASLALLQGAIGSVTVVPLSDTVANPCTADALANEMFYFPYPGDDTKFIQCDELGNAFEQTCRPNTKWRQVNETCVAVPPAPDSVCQSVGQLVPDNCNHSDFFQCNSLLQPLRLSCPAGLFYNPEGYCDSVDVNTATC